MVGWTVIARDPNMKDKEGSNEGRIKNCWNVGVVWD